MTSALTGLALVLAGSEVAAWLLLVPSTMTTSTFLFMNGLAVSAFCVGLASSARGLPTHSIARLLYEVEQDASAHRRAVR